MRVFDHFVGSALKWLTLGNLYGKDIFLSLTPKPYVFGKMIFSEVETEIYCPDIIFAAIVGAAIVYGCTNDDNRDMLGVTAIADGVSVGQGFALELLFTFMLVFFVVSITDPKKNPEPYGTTLGIGLIIVVSHVCIVSNYWNIKQ